MFDKILEQLAENPTAEQLFRSLGPGGFALALLFLGFAAGFCLAFLIWYRRMVRDTAARHQIRAAQSEIERLRVQISNLENKPREEVAS